MEIKDTKITLDSNQDLLNPDGSRFVGPFGPYYQPDWTDPLLGPCSAKVTSHGVAMSPHMSQFYSMINHHRIGLSSFSTDQCVLRAMPKLQELERKLLEAGFTVQRWCMVESLRTMMRRIPANRTATGNRLIPVAVKDETASTVKDEPTVEPQTANPDSDSRFSYLEVD